MPNLLCVSCLVSTLWSKPPTSSRSRFTAFDKAIDTILAQPFSGRRHLDHNDVFVKRILRTSFSIL